MVIKILFFISKTNTSQRADKLDENDVTREMKVNLQASRLLALPVLRLALQLALLVLVAVWLVLLALLALGRAVNQRKRLA